MDTCDYCKAPISRSRDDIYGYLTWRNEFGHAECPDGGWHHPPADPVGLTEIAERLDVKPRTAQMWRHRGLLPEPQWEVSGVPAWNWPTIRDWADATGRGSRLTAEVDQGTDAIEGAEDAVARE